MKKATIIVLAALVSLAAALVLAACFSPWAGDEGKLVVSLGGSGGSRNLLPLDPTTGTPTTPLDYELTLEGSGGTTRQAFTGTTATVRVVPGKYKLSVRGTDSSGALKAFGDMDVNVRGGANPVSLDVYSAAEVDNWVDLKTEIGGNSGSRKEIIFLKPNSTPGAWVLTSGTGSGTMNLTVPIELRANSPVTITRDSGFSNKFFDIMSGTLAIGADLTTGASVGSRITLDGGKLSSTTATASFIAVGSGCKLIINNAALINNDNTMGYGGGVEVQGGGEFFMHGGEISGNEAAYRGGGGVYVDTSGKFTMHGGTISNNKANGTGASGLGGGVYVNGSAEFTMDGGTISYNDAGNSGGGVYVNGGTFTLNLPATTGSVYGNTFSGTTPQNVDTISGGIINGTAGAPSGGW